MGIPGLLPHFTDEKTGPGRRNDLSGIILVICFWGPFTYALRKCGTHIVPSYSVDHFKDVV